MKFSERISVMRPSAIRAAGKLIAAKEGCITFAAGYPAAELMPLAEMTKITDDLLEAYGRDALQYGMTKGNDMLMDQIVVMMKEKDVICTPKNIQITTGSQQGIFLNAMLAIDKGDTVIVENPTYLGALSSFTPMECNYAGIDADDEGMDMAKLEEVLKTDKRAKLIYVVPNFSNPTGKTWSLERRKQLLELAVKYDVIIVEDNPYGDIRFDGDSVPLIKSLDTTGHVVYLGSFSKVLCAGLRVGFTISSEDIADKFEVFKQGIDLQSNEFAQFQIAEYLKRHDLNEHIKEIIANYKHKRDLMISLIDEKFPSCVKRTYPEGGMFVWVEFPESFDALKMLPDCVNEAGVGYVPGGPFYANGGHENTARLNFSTVSEEQIATGINNMAEFLKRHM